MFCIFLLIINHKGDNIRKGGNEESEKAKCAKGGGSKSNHPKKANQEQVLTLPHKIPIFPFLSGPKTLQEAKSEKPARSEKPLAKNPENQKPIKGVPTLNPEGPVREAEEAIQKPERVKVVPPEEKPDSVKEVSAVAQADREKEVPKKKKKACPKELGIIGRTGQKCQESGIWQVRGPYTTTAPIARGNTFPPYLEKAVEWELIAYA